MFCKRQWFLKLASEAPPVDCQWRQLRKFLTNVSKIEALANLLATSNINKRFLKDLKLNITNMCQVGWTHAPLFITGNRGGVSSVEKVIMTLICLSNVNWNVLKIPTTLSEKLKSIHAEIHVQRWTNTFTRSLRKTRKTHEKQKVVLTMSDLRHFRLSFCCNNDSYILILKDICLKQKEGDKISVY